MALSPTTTSGFYEDLEVEPQDHQVSSFEERLIKEIEYRLQSTAVFHDEAETSHDADHVTPEAPPRLVNGPRHAKVLSGQGVTFFCHVVGNPAPKVLWFKDGLPLAHSPLVSTVSSPGSVESRLTIASTGDSEQGTYTVVAGNSLGKVSASARLAVVSELETLMQVRRSGRSEDDLLPGRHFPPAFTQSPGAMTVREGGVTRMDVKVTGLPRPEVTWFRGSTLLPLECGVRVRALVRESGQHSLLIEATALSDAGTYRCVASNSAGTASTLVELRVLPLPPSHPPSFEPRLSPASVRAGDVAVMRARVTGEPRPAVLVRKDNEPIGARGGRVRVELDDQGWLSITIQGACRQDAGWFSVSARNSAGTSICNARLDVIEPRPLPLAPPHRATPLLLQGPASPYAALSGLGLDVRAAFTPRQLMRLVESEEL